MSALPALSLENIATRDAGWQASLALDFERRGERTVLSHVRHTGPLRVQRPFLPEGPAVPHLYILHPPGGLVPGDVLAVEVEVGPGARSLLTTPASGKIYGVGSRPLAQRQECFVRVAAGGECEWLPQDTIVFDGAEAALSSRFELAGDAKLIAWEIVTLGRQAGNAPFRTGSLRHRLEVRRDGVPFLWERLAVAGGDQMLNARWGLGGNPVFATMVATGSIDAPLLARLRAIGDADPEVFWSATLLPQLVVVRYLGSDARRALECLTRAWQLLRPAILGREAVLPRVWAT